MEYKKEELFVGNFDGAIKFLNLEAEKFYRGDIKCFGPRYDFVNTFKSNLLYSIVEFERVIKNSFNSSLKFEDVEVDRFIKMFPNGSAMFEIKTKEDLQNLGNMFSIFRNMNAHSLNSRLDYKVFRNDFNFLRKQKVYRDDISYLSENNKLTIAGLIFIIANFGRKNTIKSLTTKDNNFGLVTCGKVCVDSGEDFVATISKTNWEIAIRDDNEEDVSRAILGRLYSKAKTDDKGRFDLLLGEENNYDILVRMNVNQDEITIEHGSLTNVYYINDYKLYLKDKPHFVELANKFPPLIFVDLLYKLNISVFDEKVYEDIISEKKWSLYSKLRFPKFYSDKNIDILLADEKQADLRINSNICNGALMMLFLQLEKLIIKFYNLPLNQFDYSRITELLKIINFPRDQRDKVCALRNLSSHGAILGEYGYTNGDLYHHTLDNAINVLIMMLDYFEKENVRLYESLKNIISLSFINQILTAKTKLYVRESINFINDYPNNTDLTELKKKARFFDNSSFDSGVFKVLNEKTLNADRCLKITMEGLDVDLILLADDKNNFFQELLMKTKQHIVKQWSDGLIKYVTLKR